MLFICMFSVAHESFSQEEQKSKWRDMFSVSGYVKYMSTLSFVKLDTILTDNLIHNRINFKGYYGKYFSSDIELRTRIFYGETVKNNPLLAKQLEQDAGWMDLSTLLLNKKAMVIHTIVDRAYVDFTKGKIDFTVGRQRINWGVNLVWNPNDIFNTYNFTDFDYEERPGSDGIRIQYQMGALSGIDIAAKGGDSLNDIVVAAMYKFNKINYDFQVLGGNYYSDVMAGAGWTGNIKNAGFSGEVSYFQPRKTFMDTSGEISASLSLDYYLKNGLYVNISALYNSTGNDTLSAGFATTLYGDLNAKRLMPSQYSYFAQIRGMFNPALTGSFSVIYLQGLNGIFFMPTISYSIKENWDIDFTGQILYVGNRSTVKNVGNALFLRLRWSY